MTPHDFMRAITPGSMQPQEYGLDLYRTVTIEVHIYTCSIAESLDNILVSTIIEYVFFIKCTCTCISLLFNFLFVFFPSPDDREGVFG